MAAALEETTGEPDWLLGVPAPGFAHPQHNATARRETEATTRDAMGVMVALDEVAAASFRWRTATLMFFSRISPVWTPNEPSGEWRTASHADPRSGHFLEDFEWHGR